MWVTGSVIWAALSGKSLKFGVQGGSTTDWFPRVNVVRDNGSQLYCIQLNNDIGRTISDFHLTKDSHISYPRRVDSQFAPSQWETSLQSNAVCHWLGANWESALPTDKLWDTFCEYLGEDCLKTGPNCTFPHPISQYPHVHFTYWSGKTWAYSINDIYVYNHDQVLFLMSILVSRAMEANKLCHHWFRKWFASLAIV